MFAVNFYWYFIAALIPLIVGSVWYGPLFGKAWMKTNNFTEESLKGGNMALIFGLTYLFSLFLALSMAGMVVHQGGVAQIMMPELFDASHAQHAEAVERFNGIMADYGDRFRTFGHGALHGVFGTVFFVFPLIAINALFERRGWKYIGIHTGYWAVSLALMGGILCQMLVWAPAS